MDEDQGNVVWSSALPWSEELEASGVAALSTVRAWVRQVAQDIADEFMTDLLLVVVELVTNAIEHGGGPRCVRLSRTATDVRIEVQDTNHEELTPGESRFGAGAHRGAGLLLVRRISRDWGVRHDPQTGGKTVWTTMPCATPADQQRASMSPGETSPSRG
jgi:anti-sigma regulatory factor (Ser/Thr protein kinase)